MRNTPLPDSFILHAVLSLCLGHPLLVDTWSHVACQLDCAPAQFSCTYLALACSFFACCDDVSSNHIATRAVHTHQYAKSMINKIIEELLKRALLHSNTERAFSFHGRRLVSTYDSCYCQRHEERSCYYYLLHKLQQMVADVR